MIEGISDNIQDFGRTYTIMGNGQSKSELEETFRIRTAKYEEYYFENHAWRHNIDAERKSAVYWNHLILKSPSTVSHNNNRDLSDLDSFRSRNISSSSAQSTFMNVSTNSLTGESLPYVSQPYSQKSGQFVQTSIYGQINLTRTTQSMSSYVDSGLQETYSEDEDAVFFDLNASTKDSICDNELNDNEIQITIFYEQKRDLLTVSIHRATPVLKDSGKLFAKVSVHPGKTTKQKGQSINVQKASNWEEDFVFKKLTIGQLESSCSVTIKIYQNKGIFKSATEQYVAKVALKNVNIRDFGSTTLTLQRPKHCSC